MIMIMNFQLNYSFQFSFFFLFLFNSAILDQTQHPTSAEKKSYLAFHPLN